MSLRIQDLLVVNLPSTARKPALSWDGREQLFVAESCARQLLVGTTQDLSCIPQEFVTQARKANSSYAEDANVTRVARIKEGESGYDYLLQLTCGLLSKKRGEPHILGQIRTNWNKYVEAFQERGARLVSVMNALFEDAKKIRRAILEQLTEVSDLTCGKLLAGIEGGEKILVIAGSNSLTFDTVRELGKSGRRSAREIHIAVTNPSQSVELSKDCQEAKRRKLLASEVQVIPETNVISDGFNNFDHVFVCIPMGQNTELDEKITTTWSQRTRDKGFIVHYRGDPNARNTTSTYWQTARLRNFISPEQIKEQYSYKQQANRQVRTNAKQACENSAIARSCGKKPIEDYLTLPKDQYLKKACGCD